jgi:hypothetical protein
VTPGDIDWPPPICTPCKGDPARKVPPQHHLCVRERWCECAECPWLYDEETP